MFVLNLIMYILGILFLIFLIVYNIEKNWYNNGKCKKCGNDIEYQCSDSYLNGLYECTHCKNKMWFNYYVPQKDN